MSVRQMRKALVAVVGLLAVLATQLPPDAPEALQRWAPVVIGAATVLGVYGVRNQQPTPEPPTGSAGTSNTSGVTAKTTNMPSPGTSRVGQVYDQTQQPPTR